MSVSKPFEEGGLHHVAHVIKNTNISSPLQGSIRTAPVLPPKPSNLISSGYGTVNSFMPYGGKSISLICYSCILKHFLNVIFYIKFSY